MGPPLKSVEIKMADCREVMDRENKPYLSTDTHHLGSPCRGRGDHSCESCTCSPSNVPTPGEIWIRGSPVASGYYMMGDKTASDFTEGWFHTGVLLVREIDCIIHDHCRCQATSACGPLTAW